MWIDATTTFIYTIAALYRLSFWPCCLPQKNIQPSGRAPRSLYTLYYAAIEESFCRAGVSRSLTLTMAISYGVDIGKYHLSVLFILQ